MGFFLLVKMSRSQTEEFWNHDYKSYYNHNQEKSSVGNGRSLQTNKHDYIKGYKTIYLQNTKDN